MKQYKVRRANGSTFKTVFTTYEKARAFARSQIRQLVAKGKATRQGMWDGVSRNPTNLSLYGFRIVAV